jgi:hypothetical protein
MPRPRGHGVPDGHAEQHRHAEQDRQTEQDGDGNRPLCIADTMRPLLVQPLQPLTLWAVRRNEGS